MRSNRARSLIAKTVPKVWRVFGLNYYGLLALEYLETKSHVRNYSRKDEDCKSPELVCPQFFEDRRHTLTVPLGSLSMTIHSPRFLSWRLFDCSLDADVSKKVL